MFQRVIERMASQEVGGGTANNTAAYYYNVFLSVCQGHPLNLILGRNELYNYRE